MDPKIKAYIQIHIAVILFGFTAILGDLIQLPAIVLVWWRVLITSISLLFFIKFGKALLSLSLKVNLIFLNIGFIVAIHWICFYGSIKYANASIALVAMATTTLFASLLEPLFLNKKFDIKEMMVALLIIPGMMLIVTDLDFTKLTGFGIGIISAFLAALFAVLNKKHLKKASAFQITFLEIFGAFLLISVMLPFYYMQSANQAFMPSEMDWIYLIVLSLLCTTFAYWLSVVALRLLSAFESTLVINLEPVYGILLAIFILNDHKELSTNFYYGVIIILLAVFSYPIIKKKYFNESIQ